MELTVYFTVERGLTEATAAVDGRTYKARSSFGAIGDLFRMMLEAGEQSTPWRAVEKHTGMPGLTGKSMKTEARYTYIENDKGLCRVKWVRPSLHSFAHKPKPAGSTQGAQEVNAHG